MFLSVLSRFALGIEQFKYTKIEVHIDNEGHLTRDWEPMTITLRALSLVEKAEPVQVRFTLPLRDQPEYVNARWM
jgi:hypothetical protein